MTCLSRTCAGQAWTPRTCRVISPKMICFIIFPCTEVRLTGLQFPGSSLWPFLQVGVTLASLQSSGTFPDNQECWQMAEMEMVAQQSPPPAPSAPQGGARIESQSRTTCSEENNSSSAETETLRNQITVLPLGLLINNSSDKLDTPLRYSKKHITNILQECLVYVLDQYFT